MVSDRILIIIMISCLAAVGIAAGIKINESAFSVGMPLTAVPRREKVLSDPAFLEQVKEDSAVSADIKSLAITQSTRSTKMHEITAAGYLIGNAVTGYIYAEYNSRAIMPVASMSKLVTAFVATDMISATSTVEIVDSSLQAPPDKSNLMNGERFLLSDILYPLLLNSSNIAAEAVSSSTGDRARFMEMMRSYAWEVGMPKAFFADPSGVSPKNVATARDIFGLAGYLVNYRPDILAITRIASTTVATTTEHGLHVFQSTHPFVADFRFIGGKTGKTPEAGETMVTIMDIEGSKVAIIVLGSRNRENDTKILLRKIEATLSKAN